MLHSRIIVPAPKRPIRFAVSVNNEPFNEFPYAYNDFYFSTFYGWDLRTYCITISKYNFFLEHLNQRVGHQLQKTSNFQIFVILVTRKTRGCG